MTNTVLDPDLRIIRERILQPLMESVESLSIKPLLESAKSDGSWPDVDYANQSTTHWKPIDHLQRLLLMSRAWASPGSGLRGDERLREAIFLSLDYWLLHDFRRPWWYDVIGIPGNLSQILLLLDEGLSPAQRTKGLEIVGRATLSATGQNLVWLSLIVARRAILERDADLVAEAFRRISEEIRISAEEGLQVDHSFHQHGPCLYSHGYGAGFAVDCSSIALLVSGTRFTFPPEKIELLAGYILDGSQWMARGSTPDYGAKGREITRKGANVRYLSQACRNMLRFSTGREPEFQALLDRTEGNPVPPLEGNRHFWRSDLMVHHRPGYYASARAYSVRNVNTDGLSGCDEGLRSHHIADGCSLILRTGQEYVDIFPVWDWQRIPGTTVELGPAQSGEPRRKGTTSFVGGVSDGTYGVAACDFARDDLKARKAWFFFDREVACLGAGISCGSDHSVVTTINQCLREGEVTVRAAGTTRSLDRGDHGIKQATFVYHDGVAYVFPEETAVRLRNDAQKGSWKLISLQSPDEEIAREVFKLWIDHGKAPEGAAYAYLVAPGLSLAEIPAYASRPGPEILRNDPDLQAVRHPAAGIVGIAFYKPGILRTENGLRVTVDRACLVLLRNLTAGLAISVSNPENEGMVVNLGFEWLGLDRKVCIHLPEGMEAGKSVTQVVSR